MKFVINLHKIRTIYMCILKGCIQADVAEKLLYVRKVYAVLQQMHGK